MNFLYRMMGLVARISERLSHYRINLIPINLALITLLVLGFFASFAFLVDSMIYSGPPRTVTIADIDAHKVGLDDYVRVSGILYPDVAVQEVEKLHGSENVQNTYVPLLDTKSHRAIMVQWEGDVPGGQHHPATLTGRIQSLPQGLLEKLNAEVDPSHPLPIDQNFLLQQGAAPGNAAVALLLTLVTGFFAMLAVVTLAKKYVVFRRTAPGVPALVAVGAVPQQGIDLRLTGKLTLNEKNAKRFLDVPAGLVTLETGELALVSNIDASNRFMGITTAKRAGIWHSIVQPGSWRGAEPGLLYVGLATRPALRVHYTDAVDARPTTMILSCATEAEREAVLQDINRAAGYPIHQG